MEECMVCPCGRVWEKRNRAPDFSRRGRVHCRCNAVLGQDEEGSWDALLIAPRERFGAIRKLAGHAALILLRLSRSGRNTHLALDQTQFPCFLAQPEQGSTCSA